MSNTLEFPDFSLKCPICGRPRCASRHATYIRGYNSDRIAIQRWKCNNKNRPPGSHLTFSVLPYQLIPYCKYGIDFAYRCFQSRVSKKSILDIATDQAMLIGIDAAFLSQVAHYALLFRIAIVKWQTLYASDTKLPEKLYDMNLEQIRQACIVFYIRKNDFLFGEPSQNNIRAP